MFSKKTVIIVMYHSPKPCAHMQAVLPDVSGVRENLCEHACEITFSLSDLSQGAFCVVLTLSWYEGETVPFSRLAMKRY